MCLCVAISWGCNGKSEQLSFLLSPGNPLLTCNLYWITPTLIVSPNVSLRIQIVPHQHRIFSIHFIYVDTKNKNHLPLPQQPLSRHCWARHLISSWSTRAVSWSTVEDFDYFCKVMKFCFLEKLMNLHNFPISKKTCSNWFWCFIYMKLFIPFN